MGVLLQGRNQDAVSLPEAGAMVAEASLGVLGGHRRHLQGLPPVQTVSPAPHSQAAGSQVGR